MPRILSPAYFQHYNAQTVQAPRNSGTTLVKSEEVSKRSTITKSKETIGEQLVLGLGPVQTSVWRLSKLVPLEAVRKHLNIFKSVVKGVGQASSMADRDVPLTIDETEAEPQSLEIEEGSEVISLNPLPDKEDRGPFETNGTVVDAKNNIRVGNSKPWHRVLNLPSYVPFGQVRVLSSHSYSILSTPETIWKGH